MCHGIIIVIISIVMLSARNGMDDENCGRKGTLEDAENSQKIMFFPLKSETEVKNLNYYFTMLRKHVNSLKRKINHPAYYVRCLWLSFLRILLHLQKFVVELKAKREKREKRGGENTKNFKKILHVLLMIIYREKKLIQIQRLT